MPEMEPFVTDASGNIWITGPNGKLTLAGGVGLPVTGTPASGDVITAGTTGATWAPASASGGGQLIYAPAAGTDLTGSTDVSAAVQAAVTAAAAAGGGDVYLKTGRYKLTSAVALSSAVRVFGDGPGRTIVLPYGLVPAFSALSGSQSVPYTDVSITDLEIDGTNQSGTYASTIKGISAQYMVRAVFRNLYIHGTGATGLGADYLQETRIENCALSGCGRLSTTAGPGGAGIGIGSGHLSSVREDVTISGCYAISNATYGIFVEAEVSSVIPSAAGAVITGNYTYGNNYGIGCSGSAGMLVTGNTCQADAAAGIVVDSGTTDRGAGQDSVISGNVIYSPAGPGIYVNPANQSIAGVQITGNRVIGAGGQGIKLSGSTTTSVSDVAVTDNTVRGCTGGGIAVGTATAGTTFSAITIAGNRVYNSGSGKAGIHVATNITGLYVQNNICYDNQGTKTQTYGLLIDGAFTATTGVISDNDFRGNLTGTLSVTATLSGVSTSALRGVVTLTDASTIAVDASLGTIFAVTLTASGHALGVPANPFDGQEIKIRFIQPGSGGPYTINGTWNAVYDFGTAGAPTLSTGPGNVDIVTFQYIGALSKWACTGTVLGL